MAAEFWAGYFSGAAGIIIGNPLDVVKVRLQAGQSTAAVPVAGVRPHVHVAHLSTLAVGTAAPILGYGALNALLFTSYKRAENVLSMTQLGRYTGLWLAGAFGGLCTWVISAPTELVKCRAQVSAPAMSSWAVARQVWGVHGLRGLYLGGTVTALRDSIGYGFYFWSYEVAHQLWPSASESGRQDASRILLCGGLAGIMSWASVFPLDVIKTRVQARHLNLTSHLARPHVLEVIKSAYAETGCRVFFRGLTVCSIRAFVVNAVQWAIYERAMIALVPRL
ncbi:hypothetical protein HIM_04804 [Hirsutella minnesotensis 3608]|uniref:Mitochondrial basic amino acids transporter n=1 Tax=Hirsutella minnesotensis 3608 TaxID=1043627 RepID=A0A0F8A0W1_9HYPO|nr:hypothetical protein HIM_04804 [Hirsutella minnesotensis 3608]